jgi:hypothetical protein
MRCDGGEFRVNLYLMAPDSDLLSTVGLYSIMRPGIPYDDLD